MNLRPLILALCTLWHFPMPAAAEQLVYSAGWRLFDAGRATIELGTGEASVVVKTHGVVGRLHPVNVRYRSTYSDGMCALSSLLRADEGDEQSETAVTFEAGMARRVETDLKLQKKQTGEVATPACVHDLLGGLMKIRGLRLKPGAETTLPLSDGKKSIQARVAALNVETVSSKAGQFRATRYQVFLYDGAFFRKKGRLFVWISEDDQRLPVQMKVELPFYIGDITVALDSVTASTTQ